jgi:hypothetical protein
MLIPFIKPFKYDLINTLAVCLVGMDTLFSSLAGGVVLVEEVLDF